MSTGGNLRFNDYYIINWFTAITFSKKLYK